MTFDCCIETHSGLVVGVEIIPIMYDVGVNINEKVCTTNKTKQQLISTKKHAGIKNKNNLHIELDHPAKPHKVYGSQYGNQGCRQV